MPSTASLSLVPESSAQPAGDWRIAVVALPTLPLGELANTVAVLSIGLGAAAPMLGGAPLQDRHGRGFASSANKPVPVLQADSDAMRTLLAKALPAPEGAVAVVFPRFARQLHVYADYISAMPERDLTEEVIDGIGLAGAAKWVRSLTGSLKLMR
jgi:hypothetical protein